MPVNPRANRPKRDADDTSSLPSILDSAPGEKTSMAGKELDAIFNPGPNDLQEIPIFGEMLGGVLLSASNAEANAEVPKEFHVLSPQARMACRLRSGGMRPSQIANLMQYAPSSIGVWLSKPLAKKYILWLQGTMDAMAPVVQDGMQLLGLKALDRLTAIIHNSTNDNLVAKCSFQLFDRIGLKPAERIVVEDNRTITAADIAKMKETGASLQSIIIEVPRADG